MSTRIRRATLDEGAEIHYMAGNFMRAGVYGRVFGLHADRLADYVVTLLDHGVIFVAEVEEPTAGGTIVGGFTWRIRGFVGGYVGAHHPLNGEPFAEEVVCWVDPLARQKRLGPKLWRSFEQWARQEGAVMLKMSAPVEPDGSWGTLGAYYIRDGYVPLETAFIKRLT